jgi:ABC-type uncharacterized transport system permease subunit
MESSIRDQLLSNFVLSVLPIYGITPYVAQTTYTVTITLACNSIMFFFFFFLFDMSNFIMLHINKLSNFQSRFHCFGSSFIIYTNLVAARVEEIIC